MVTALVILCLFFSSYFAYHCKRNGYSPRRAFVFGLVYSPLMLPIMFLLGYIARKALGNDALEIDYIKLCLFSLLYIIGTAVECFYVSKD